MNYVFVFIVLLVVSNASLAKKKNYFGTSPGTFVFLDKTNNQFKFVNKELAELPQSPCSTFKVPHSIFGLEAGYLTGKDFAQKYKPKKNPRKNFWPKSWTEDHTLETAIKNSVVWYYQGVARNIGKERMQTYMNRLGFGNNDISGGIDKFWLSSSLRISPLEQVKTWDRLFSRKTDFKASHIDLVKQLIVLEKNSKYTLRAKTGTCRRPNGKLGGWLVGFIEKAGRPYYFATFLEGQKFGELSKSRMRITKEILTDFGVL